MMHRRTVATGSADDKKSEAAAAAIPAAGPSVSSISSPSAETNKYMDPSKDYVLVRIPKLKCVQMLTCLVAALVVYGIGATWFFETEVSEQVAEIESLEGNVNFLEEKLRDMPNAMSKLDLMERKSSRYQDEMKKMSMRVLMEEFGEGPFTIEMMVEFHGGTHRIVLELAPVDEMPHATHLFMEQVKNNLYVGTTFHHNFGHVLLVGPNKDKPDKTRDEEQIMAAFEDSGYMHLGFQEYSESYPHEEMTIGYNGRPGGPDFYFNLEDNTAIQGPGGQPDFEDPTEADSCFGRVVEGVDIVKKIARMPRTHSEELKDPVEITSMKLLPQEETDDREEEKADDDKDARQD
eukprot:CAMPEP_0118686464 /NCGR_PEP_ID=MMETSP0800-20121206/7828_1 /TAXON_ID=210618 ORGANISM="Striatella unipunctata, Strain CCMP2910" /NCGR_SAMPLE_ID=MMETSP0800 /ASSEMBLY_ACC=CAM_ASM_000638 /LENGTH=347 /DNA_ID=CAMNT_0006583513 /DNA_START=92 /DNA_END=1135 /DNA_ORIENTATION=-